MTDINKFKQGLEEQRKKLAAIQDEHQELEIQSQLSAEERLTSLKDILRDFILLLHDFAKQNVYTVEEKTYVEESHSTFEITVQPIPPDVIGQVNKDGNPQLCPLRFTFTLSDDNKTRYAGEVGSTRKPAVSFLRSDRPHNTVSCVGYMTKVQLRDIEDAAMLLQQWQVILELSEYAEPRKKFIEDYSS